MAADLAGATCFCTRHLLSVLTVSILCPDIARRSAVIDALCSVLSSTGTVVSWPAVAPHCTVFSCQVKWMIAALNCIFVCFFFLFSRLAALILSGCISTRRYNSWHNSLSVPTVNCVPGYAVWKIISICLSLKCKERPERLFRVMPTVTGHQSD